MDALHVPGAIGHVETRNYTDTLVDAIISASAGTGNTGFDSFGRGVAALQAASNLYGAAFALADVSPADSLVTRAIGPAMLRSIGEGLIRSGEVSYKIDVTAGRLAFLPAIGWDIDGGPQEESWRYLIDIPSPSGQQSQWINSTSVLHFRYTTDQARPWVGLSPLQRSPLTAGIATALEEALRDEAAGTHGYVLPVPSDPATPVAATLKTDLAKLKGKTQLVRTTSGGWGEGATARPQSEWTPRRLGANPPDSLIGLRADTFAHVLSACGVPVSLFLAGEGGGQRESWRRFCFGSIQPLGETVAEELSEKLELEISLSFDKLFASDITGRARAFQSMVTGGMDIQRAAALSGLVEMEG